MGLLNFFCWKHLLFWPKNSILMVKNNLNHKRKLNQKLQENKKWINKWMKYQIICMFLFTFKAFNPNLIINY